MAEPGPPRVMVKTDVEQLQHVGRAQDQHRGQAGPACRAIARGQQRPLAACLQPRRLFDLDRHHRQAGQEDQREERRPLPDVHRRDGDEGAGRIAKPVRAARSRTSPANRVGDAEVAVEDQPTDQTDDGVGRRQRNDQRHAGQRAQHSKAGPMQHQRDDHAEPDLDRHRAEKEQPGRPSVCQNVGSVSA